MFSIYLQLSHFPLPFSFLIFTFPFSSLYESYSKTPDLHFLLLLSYQLSFVILSSILFQFTSFFFLHSPHHNVLLFFSSFATYSFFHIVFCFLSCHHLSSFQSSLRMNTDKTQRAELEWPNWRAREKESERERETKRLDVANFYYSFNFQSRNMSRNCICAPLSRDKWLSRRDAQSWLEICVRPNA